MDFVRYLNNRRPKLNAGWPGVKLMPQVKFLGVRGS